MKERSAKKRMRRLGGSEKAMEARQKSASFVMTLWLEPREAKAEAEPEWRWRVQHVQTGEQAYFRRWADVVAFVASQSGLPGPS